MMHETFIIPLIVLVIVFAIDAGNQPFEKISTISGVYCIFYGAAAIISGVFNLISVQCNITVPSFIQEKICIYKLDLFHISLYILSLAVGIIFVRSKDAADKLEVFIAVGIFSLILTFVILISTPTSEAGLLICGTVVYMIGIVKKYQVVKYYKNKK
ncbi:MAG: hypothetical protein HFE63_02305 [Clostridiales bacterium]|nr:hypothetical protein [Clostridiales bacterium]